MFRACCTAILVYCSVRDWTRICYISGFENIRIHPSTRYRIRCGFIFATLESGFKNNWSRCRTRRMRVDGSRIRKEKVADSKISRYVWTGPKLIDCSFYFRKCCVSSFTNNSYFGSFSGAKLFVKVKEFRSCRISKSVTFCGS